MTDEELTLDPANWDEFRDLAHRMVDDLLAHLKALRSRPAWQPLPDEVRARLNEPLPVEPQGEEAAYQAFLQDVLPYTNGNLHPRYFGWVQGNGTPLSMMADMLASGINPHMGGFNQAPKLVEEQVIRWFVELLGFPPGASGLLVLGGSMANLLGLAVARHAVAGFDVRELGLYAGSDRLIVYASSETHAWITKAVELMGLGRSSLRRVPIETDYRIDVAALRGMIRDDRQQGLRPICIVGNAGTVNTGATDDLRALGRVARDEGLWFHVDGAYGALVRLSPRLRALVQGIEDADSVAFDLHKWMYQPFDVACLLVRDAAAHRATFATAATYIASTERGVMAGGLPFADLGIDLTRGFRALKVWMSLKAYGVGTFARLIEQDLSRARHLEGRISAQPDLELLAPVSMNVVCFRFAPKGFDDETLNRVNQELLLRLQETGVAVPSSTELGGRFAIRCAIINHRSRREDLDSIIDAVIRIGGDILSGVA